jgi:hypothetical protein
MDLDQLPRLPEVDPNAIDGELIYRLNQHVELLEILRAPPRQIGNAMALLHAASLRLATIEYPHLVRSMAGIYHPTLC